MNSQTFDVKIFISAMEGRRLKDVIEAIRKEVSEVHDLSFRSASGTRAQRSGSIEYLQDLKALEFFLRSNVKPSGLREDVFQLFKPLCKSLVEMDELVPQFLRHFENPPFHFTNPQAESNKERR